MTPNEHLALVIVSGMCIGTVTLTIIVSLSTWLRNRRAARDYRNYRESLARLGWDKPVVKKINPRDIHGRWE